LDTTNRFLDTRPFATNPDRTNCLAGAITLVLRNHWPGAKPLFAVTATKSHAGKDTIIYYICGDTPHCSISYERTDWALEKSFVSHLRHNPDIGLVCLENARLGRGDKEICSAWVERFVTSPQPSLFANGFREPIYISNHVVVAVSTNHGDLSTDWLNRANLVHLAPLGDIASRVSPLGNVRYEFLPRARDRLQAELRGLINRWVAAGMPLDETVKHAFSTWAKVVGGILLVSNFTDFQANYSAALTQVDPLRRGLAELGAALPNEWRSAADWAQTAIRLGIRGSLIPPNCLENNHSMATGLGKVLTCHQLETLIHEGDDVSRTFRLERDRRRFESGAEPEVRYQFRLLPCARRCNERLNPSRAGWDQRPLIDLEEPGSPGRQGSRAYIELPASERSSRNKCRSEPRVAGHE
jgi:hypothetical protein